MDCKNVVRGSDEDEDRLGIRVDMDMNEKSEMNERRSSFCVCLLLPTVETQKLDASDQDRLGVASSPLHVTLYFVLFGESSIIGKYDTLPDG